MQFLNPKQETAVAHGEGPLLILAGAGSGKTRTLTARLLKLIERGIPPREIIAITFTNKAAREMFSRVEHRLAPGERHDGFFPRNAPFIGTFHAFGARILRSEAARFCRTRVFTIADEEDAERLIRAITKELNIGRERWSVPLLRHILSRAKNELADFALLEEAPRAVGAAYEAALRKQNAFDFDDLIEKVVRLFLERPEVRKGYVERFRYILVDEFQDVNTAQYALVKLLAGTTQNLCVVGDDAQSIYRFRGSDFRNFLNFERDWPRTTVITLDQNYRSTATIIAAASAVIARNVFQKPKELWTENPPGEPIAVCAARDKGDEAEWVADAILGMRGGTRGTTDAETIAILYRTNAQSRALEQALIGRDIPYRIFGGLTFYARKEVKDVIAALRTAANPRDELAAERLRKTFPRRLSEPLIRELRAASGQESPLELIHLFLARTDYYAFLARTFPNAEERAENLKELITFASDFSATDEFLERVSLLEAADRPSNERNAKRGTPVHLMTIHLAKGLEFDRVFLTGSAEGFLPHLRSLGSPDELEEERRLMYVAMTRAKHALTVSFSGLPSRFLYEIPPELTEVKNTENRSLSLEGDELYLEE